MKWISHQRQNSVLGLNLTGGRLSAVHVVRAKGTIAVVNAFTAALRLDLMQSAVEPLGREIKDALAATGMSERRCAVAIPAQWIMSQHTKVPKLSPEDLTSFLQLEAEKGFPCDPAHLQIARSVCLGEGANYVTQLAVRREQIERLVAILSAAGLKPVSFSPGLVTLPGAIPAIGEGRITVDAEPKGVTLLYAAGGGIAALRTCEATLSSATGEERIDASVVARELRITVEQVPTELRVGLGQLALYGDETLVLPLTESLTGWAKATGLTITPSGMADHSVGEQMAEGIAARWLEIGTPAQELLPPRPSRWSGWLTRYDSKRLAFAGFVLGAMVLLTLGFFGWQEFRRWSLRSEWGVMQVQVTSLEALQANIREYRPWYDTTFHSLSILRSVTESFPDNGSVTARSFEIHGPSSVSISGTARDNTSLLRTLDQLRKTREVQDLKIEQIRGKAPLQFTLSFRWGQ